MLKKVFTSLKQLSKVSGHVSAIERDIEHIKINQGKILAQANRTLTNEILNNLHQAEFKVFSQFGDDGIIQFLVEYLQIDKKTFIEFGVENYKESNTRFLLINNNWSGLIMDGSLSNIKQVQQEEIYWKYNLTAVPAFIKKENINSLIKSSGFDGEAGLLHIDIDGNDYWIWKEINCVSPVIVIVEYNSLLGHEKPWTIPYHEDFVRTKFHYSGLYYGASLLALTDLAEEKGYYFIGCNSNGNNAYFIRKDKIRSLKVLSAEEGYVLSNVRESRDKNGNLSFVAGDKRVQLLKGLNIYNTRTQQLETL